MDIKKKFDNSFSSSPDDKKQGNRNKETSNIKAKLNNLFIYNIFTKKKKKDELNELEKKKKDELQDCAYTQKELDIDGEIESENKKSLDNNLESAIKKLDIWDTEHLIDRKNNYLNGIKNYVENSFGNMKSIWTKRRTSTINCSKDSPSILNNSIMNLSPRKKPYFQAEEDYLKNSKKAIEAKKNNLPGFLDKEELDQICILLQNINIFRRKFNFNIFKDKVNKEMDTNNDKKSLNHYSEVSSHKNDQKSVKNPEQLQSFNLNQGLLSKDNNIRNNSKSLINSKSSASITKDGFFINKDSHNFIETIKTKQNNNDNNNFNNKERKKNSLINNSSLFSDNLNNQNNGFSQTTNGFFKSGKLNLHNELTIQTQENFLGNKIFDIEDNKLKTSSFSKRLESDGLSGFSSIKLNSKFKIATNVSSTAFETHAKAKNENYINKKYFECISNFKKNLEVNDHVKFLNTGQLINIKSKENPNQLNNNLHSFDALKSSLSRISTSCDVNESNKLNRANISKFNITYPMNFFDKSQSINNDFSNFLNKIPKDIQQLKNFINLKNLKSLHKDDKKILIKAMNDSNNTNNEDIPNKKFTRVVGKDPMFKYFQGLLDKYKELKETRSSLRLDDVDYYKKVMKNKIEKENAIRKE